MIRAADVMPMLVRACPSFAPTWASLQDDEIHLGQDGTRLTYLDAGEFTRHLVEQFAAGEIDEVRGSFVVIEAMHTDGDEYVRELATIGFLEGVQTAAAHDSRCEPADFEAFLGVESRRWWRGLEAFWSGGAPTVTALDGA
ncbi:MAG TPA: hypothetical protein VFL10_18030 [Ornithinibacter sp.]|nr:hypothetical protein [Ornithinibacter sp.]